jgi:signal recognition particle receptor subunit beta
MSTFNFRNNEICIKVVYVGPALGGKTTNVERLHQLLPGTARSDLRMVKTDEDRTLFFDFFTLDLPLINGMKTRISITGVPGQPFYRATRRAALSGVDGLVFVADSQQERAADNQESLDDITTLLQERHLDIKEMPLVFQWNKRDLPDIMSPADLNALLNPRGLPAIEGVAIENKGVSEAFKAVVKLIVARMTRDKSTMRGGN